MAFQERKGFLLYISITDSSAALTVRLDQECLSQKGHVSMRLPRPKKATTGVGTKGSGIRVNKPSVPWLRVHPLVHEQSDGTVQPNIRNGGGRSCRHQAENPSP